MATLLQELRYAVRRLSGRPGFTAVVLLTLALAMGANVAIFAVVNAVLLRPLPYPEPERIVEIRHHAPGLNLPELRGSSGLLELYRESARGLEAVVGARTGSRNIAGSDRPERVRVLEVGPEFFDVMRTSPTLGRPVIEADAQEGAAPVAILSYSHWQSRLGGDPEVVGRRVDVEGTSTEIVGVMPPEFEYPHPETALFLPLVLESVNGLGAFELTALARLAPGVELDAARAELHALQARISERFPDMTEEVLELARWSVSVAPLRDRIVGDVSTTLWVLLGTVGLVLLIAGANVANLLLVRAEARRREMALRSALGAGGGRLAIGFLSESIVLGLVGGALGLLIASGGIELLIRYGPAELPRLHEVRLDAAAASFAVALGLLAGVVLGLLPLPRVVREGSATALQGGGRQSTATRERHGARRVLIIGQIALALVLLVSAGLMLRTLVRMHAIEPGFRAEGVLAVGVGLGQSDPTRSGTFTLRLLDELSGLPGVESVGVTNSIPIQPSGYNGGSLEIESRPTDESELPPVAMWHVVTDGYFETLGIPLIAGRAPTRSDAFSERRVAWVNQTFSQRYLEGNAVGKRIRIGADSEWIEIAGVVGDVRAFGLLGEIEPLVTFPLGTTAPISLEVMHFVLRTDGDPLALAPHFRAAVDGMDGSIPVTAVRTMEDVLATATAQSSFTFVLLLISAVVALILGVVGLYGVISYVVSLRTVEFGVRIALGAQPGAVRSMVLRQGFHLVLIGVAAGLVVAAAVTRFMDSLLFEVSARDPATFALVAGVLMVTSLLAAYVPARRATAVDPMTALRTE